jgi:hypothetical protein
MFQCIGSGLNTATQPQLGKEAVHIITNRSFAQEKCLGDFLI